MPPRVAALARDARGYPIPYTARYDQGGMPDFRAIDSAKWMRAVRTRCCGICGEPLGGRVAFVGGPQAMQNRLFTDLPMHRDCAIYALKVCPMLAAPKFAYTRAIGVGTGVNEHVSTVRRERFGLGVTRQFELAQLGTEIVLHAGLFESITWWAHGAEVPA